MRIKSLALRIFEAEKKTNFFVELGLMVYLQTAFLPAYLSLWKVYIYALQFWRGMQQKSFLSKYFLLFNQDETANQRLIIFDIYLQGTTTTTRVEVINMHFSQNANQHNVLFLSKYLTGY